MCNLLDDINIKLSSGCKFSYCVNSMALHEAALCNCPRRRIEFFQQYMEAADRCGVFITAVCYDRTCYVSFSDVLVITVQHVDSKVICRNVMASDRLACMLTIVLAFSHVFCAAAP